MVPGKDITLRPGIAWSGRENKGAGHGLDGLKA